MKRRIVMTLLLLADEGDPVLFNPYGVIAVDPGKNAEINAELAMAYIAWLVSVPTQELIDEEVARILMEAEQRAEQVLREHRGELETITRALMEEEELNEEQLTEKGIPYETGVAGYKEIAWRR